MNRYLWNNIQGLQVESGFYKGDKVWTISQGQHDYNSLISQNNDSLKILNRKMLLVGVIEIK